MAATQVLAGFHAVIARMRQAPATIREVYVEAQRRDKRMQTLLDQLAQAGVSVHATRAWLPWPNRASSPTIWTRCLTRCRDLRFC